MGTSHHRLPGADLDAFGKVGPAGKHLESNRYSPPSAWGFFVCCLGGLFWVFCIIFILALCLEGDRKGAIFFLCV